MVECELLYLRTLPESDMRFNRYMVECECGSIAISKSYNKVLIDTWWNVNLAETGTTNIIIGFNRYMVECESAKVGVLKEVRIWF